MTINVPEFTPSDWFWIVNGDEARAWSSASSSYVTELNSDKVTRINSEAELVETLKKFGLDGPLPVEDAKTEYSDRVDREAEEIRIKVLTPGSGMAMTYQEKFAQAQAVMGLGVEPANALTEAERISLYPTLAASVGIDAPSLYECAQLVVSKYEAWAALSYVIESERLKAKAAIKAASDLAGVKAAYGAISWPTI